MALGAVPASQAGSVVVQGEVAKTELRGAEGNRGGEHAVKISAVGTWQNVQNTK